MNLVRALWSSVQGDAVYMRRINGWLTIAWIAMIPVSIAFGWLNSVVYVSALSLWALVSGHWSAWQAARVEVKQDRQGGGGDPPGGGGGGRRVPPGGGEVRAGDGGPVRERFEDEVPVAGVEFAQHPDQQRLRPVG